MIRKLLRNFLWSAAVLASIGQFIINAVAADRVVDKRLSVGAPWNALTGHRTLIRARVDTVARRLFIEKYDSDTSYRLKNLVWRREFPLNNLEDAQRALRELENNELNWDVVTFVRMHSKDCSALFFEVPRTRIAEFATQGLRIVERLEAANEDLGMQKLIRIKARCGLPEFYLGMVQTVEGLVRRFGIMTEDRQRLALNIVEEQGQILIRHGDKSIVRLSPVDDFSARYGGRFYMSVIEDCQNSTYREYEFELKRERREGNEIWKLDAYRELDGTISLVGDRDPEIDVGMTIVSAPVELVEGVLDGIFGTLIWNIFVSNQGKKELVEKSIFEEAKKNETLREVFSDQELRKMASEIASSSRLPWFAPFSSTEPIKKRASMIFAYHLVEKLVLDKLPEGSHPDMASGVATRVTRDLEKCLNRASTGSHIDVCVAKFARSAPYRVGKELLRLHMTSGLRGLDLSTEERAEALNVANMKFDQCAQSNYFRKYDEHIRKTARERRQTQEDPERARRQRRRKGLLDDDLPFDSTKVVMSCLFQAASESAIRATEISVDKILSESGPGNQDNEQKRRGVIHALEQCFSREGIMHVAQGFRQYDHEFIQTLDVLTFQPKFNGCLATAKQKAGEVILAHSIFSNQSLQEATVGMEEKRQQVYDRTIEKAFTPCMQKQGANADPARCTTMLENVATEESFVLILEHQMAETFGAGTPALDFALREVGLGTQPATQYGFNLRQCFQDRLNSLFTLLEDNQTLPTDDFSNANCVTRAVLAMAPVMVRHQYLKTINAKPDLKEITALKDPAFITSMGSTMRECLYQELKGQDTVAGVSSLLEGAQTRCTVNLYKDILPKVMEKALNAKLLTIVPNEERRQALIERLINEFKHKMLPLDSETQLMQLLDTFSEDIVIDIVKQSLHWNIEDNIPSQPAEQELLQLEITNQIVTPEWEQAMRQAIRNSDTATQTKLQSQLKKRAGPIIMERAIPIRLQEVVPQASTRQVIADGVVRQYRKCLEKINDDAADFEAKFSQCATQATNQATHGVFDGSLQLALQQYFPLTGTAADISGNRTAQKQIKSRLLVKKLWSEIASANASGPVAVTRLGERFKVRAAREIANILLERELIKSLTGTVYESVKQRAQANSEICFNNIEGKIERRESVNVQSSIDLCSKKIKVETAFMAMESIFHSKMGILAGNQPIVDEIIRLSSAYFQTCTNGYQDKSMTQVDALVSDCINRTVLHFAQTLGRKTLDYFSPIRVANQNVFSLYQTCLTTIENQRSRGLDFIKTEIDRCVATILKPKLVAEIHSYYNSLIPSNISGGQRAVVEDSFTLLAPAFDGKLSTSSGSGTDVVTSLDETFHQLIKFITPAATFDQVFTQRRITEFKGRIRSLTSSRTISQREFTEELVTSNLMNTIIEAQITHVLWNVAGDGWLGAQAKNRVLTPDNIRNFFESDPRGVALMSAIKAEVVRPLLAGQSMGVIMANIESQVRAEVAAKITEIKDALL